MEKDRDNNSKGNMTKSAFERKASKEKNVNSAGGKSAEKLPDQKQLSQEPVFRNQFERYRH